MADARPLGPAQVGVGRALPVKVINRKTKKKDHAESSRIDHLNKVVREEFTGGLSVGSQKALADILRKSKHPAGPSLAVAHKAAIRLREEHSKIKDKRRKSRLLKGSKK